MSMLFYIILRSWSLRWSWENGTIGFQAWPVSFSFVKANLVKQCKESQHFGMNSKIHNFHFEKPTQGCTNLWPQIGVHNSKSARGCSGWFGTTSCIKCDQEVARNISRNFLNDFECCAPVKFWSWFRFRNQCRAHTSKTRLKIPANLYVFYVRDFELPCGVAQRFRRPSWHNFLPTDRD